MVVAREVAVLFTDGILSLTFFFSYNVLKMQMLIDI